MDTHTFTPVGQGHAHDVDLEDTFDFLNTDDTEDGFPVDRLPDARRGPDLVRRPRRHPQRRRRSDPRRGGRRSRALQRATSPASRRSGQRSARCRCHSPSTGSVVCCPRHDQPSAPRATGHRARARHRRHPRRPSPRRRPGRRRPGPPGRPARARADGRSPGTDQGLRERHLRLDLLRLVTDEPPALVRHGDLRQPGQGRPAPRPRTRGRRPTERTRTRSALD